MAWGAFGGWSGRQDRAGPIFGVRFFALRRHGRGRLACQEEKGRGENKGTSAVGFSTGVGDGRRRFQGSTKQTSVSLNATVVTKSFRLMSSMNG